MALWLADCKGGAGQLGPRGGRQGSPPDCMQIAAGLKCLRSFTCVSGTYVGTPGSPRPLSLSVSPQPRARHHVTSLGSLVVVVNPERVLRWLRWELQLSPDPKLEVTQCHFPCPVG